MADLSGMKRRARRAAASSVAYIFVIGLALSAATVSMQAQGEAGAGPAAAASQAPKSYFSLSTNRTFSTGDRTRVWINYQGVDHLDFRVYRVSDPVQFFGKLEDPHKMGKREREEVAASYRTEPSLLEKLRSFKVSVFIQVRDFFRKQLQRSSRETFNQKFRGEEDRRPLNVADYARVPLLNPDHLVSSWREVLKPLDNEYETRLVMLGKREPGVYLVEAVNGGLRAYTVAVVTDLALVTKTAAGGEVLVYTVNRKTGEPRKDASILVTRRKKTLATATTDKDGIARLKIETRAATGGEPQRPGDQEPKSYLLTATEGDDFALSDLEPYYFGGGGEDEEGDVGGFSPGTITGYVYTDRPVYRPEQKVFFKGILRTSGENGYETPGGRLVEVEIEDPNSGKVFQREVTLSAKGTFSGELDLRRNAPLGSYRIIARVDEGTASGYFEVQEYKKPEFKVTVTPPGQFIRAGSKVKFTIEARYFFGEPVSGADVQYYIYRSRYYPWWWYGDDELEPGEESGEEGDSYGYGNDIVKDDQATLDDKGRLVVDFEVPEPEQGDSWDYSYRLEAQVTDASRRMIEGRASFVGTRGDVVASIQSDRYLYNKDETAKIRVSTTDYEGRPVKAKLSLTFVQRNWERREETGDDGKKHYQYDYRPRELSSTTVDTDSQGQAVHSFRVPTVGSIEITGAIVEGNKKTPTQAAYIWVAEKQQEWTDFAYEDYGAIKLVPDKKHYAPGETAHVLVMLPTERAHLLVTAELNRVMTARHIASNGRVAVVDVPIEDRFSPNVYLGVSYIKDGEMYTSDKLLNVPARQKFLNIEIVADKKEYKPRETATYTIVARNADSKPAAGVEVSLGVVDEAVYSIRPDRSGDIRKAFYGRRYNQVQTAFSVSYYFSGYSGDNPINLSANKSAFQLADFKNEGQYAEPTIRKEFKDTTFWQPDVITGADGKARVTVTLPDNLTTWRATARAVSADTRVGSGVAKVVARKDLILRLETPRFLTEGDTVTLSGIVHNYLDSDKVAKVSIELNGAQLLNESTRTFTVARKGQQRVDWQVKSGETGEVRLLAKALTDAESDAIEIPLPVVPHGLLRKDGGAHAISADEADRTISLDLPANANPRARSLRVEAAPSVAGTLFGGLDYLTSYPYGCVEQTMSGFLPNIAVAQALKNVKSASIRASNQLGAKVQRGLDRLYGFQHEDGGWGWWEYDETDPFMTAYVVDGLVMASKSGFSIESWRVDRGRQSLKNMISAGKSGRGFQIDAETRAYMVYALTVSGSDERSYVDELFSRRNELQPYGRALLALTLKLRGDDNRLRQAAAELANAARVSEFDAYWESQRRPMLDFSEDNDIEATALALRVLAQSEPRSPLLAKVARWLVANRANGYYWESTKQTAFAIFGLIDYLKVSNELSPDYTLEVYVNGQPLITKRITAAEAAESVPLLIEKRGSEVAGRNQVRVVKRGRGALYLSATVEYFTAEDQVAQQSSPELNLTREYLRLRVTEAGDGKAKWTVEPLTGDVRSGDLIVARLRLGGKPAQYILVEDPIPAGCEQVDRVSGIDLDYNAGGWSDWYSAREFRDQKTVIFLDYFDGSAMFQYALRVQVPGEFRVGPARAELMYRPASQANTASSRLRILDK